jgi:pyruvate formate lyase activating enzyme
MSVEDVMKEVRKDRTFYYESGGGVTLSGGEPSAQYKFAVKILEQCNEEGIDTALETCGYARWEVLEQLVQNVNLVLYDIKHMDSKEHKSYVGEDNGLILENARKIATLGKKMIIRVPIIPTYNDSIKHIQKLVDFVISLKTVNEIHLLPYHALGKGKYIRLGLKYSLGDLKSPDHYEMEKLKDICINAGLIAHIGG